MVMPDVVIKVCSVVPKINHLITAVMMVLSDPQDMAVPGIYKL